MTGVQTCALPICFAQSTLAGPRWTGRVELIPSKLDEPLRWRKPRRVFVNSMSDLFHEALLKTEIEQVFDVMSNAPRHTFQVLTKRPERMQEFMEWRVERRADLAPNVWLGVSVEDQATADERIPLLLQTPAAVRFVSLEPALGPVDFDGPSPYPDKGWLCGWHAEPEHASGCDGSCSQGRCPEAVQVQNERLDWLIVGGESGPGARPFDVAWARPVVAQCKAAGVACFVKQLGARPMSSDYADRAFYSGADHRLNTIFDPKGGAPSEWPEDLRVREFPA